MKCRNWKENSYKRKDEKYQKLREARDRETDPVRKEQKSKKLDAYWAKRRKELGFKDEEE